MKHLVSALLVLMFSAGFVCAADKPAALETEIQKLSYAMGLDLGAYFKNLDEDFDLEVLARGLGDAYSGKEPQLAAEEISAVQQAFAQRQQEKQVAKTVETVQKNNTAAEEFLKANKAKEGIVETASGLQYKVVKAGDGNKPTAENVVKVHYKGTLLDGTEFDSSYTRKEPAVFQVGQVIPGWQEALQLMDVGSTYELFIPADLAYGDRGAPPVIEPGSMLIFQVELLEIQEAEASEAVEAAKEEATEEIKDEAKKE